MDAFDSNAIREAAAEAREVISEMVANLSEAAERDDKFFRNGIELIDFEISIGSPEKPIFTIKAKIAGPKPGETASKDALALSYPGATG